MTTISGHNVYVNRESGEFQVQVNYSIPGYYDPETGEYFGNTSWSVSFGTGGTGGWEYSESASPIIYLGLSSGPINRYPFVFDAQNTFSGVSYHFEMTVHESGFSYDPLSVTGNGGIDLVVTGSGADTVDGAGGDDYLDLGAGNDIAYGGDGQDYIDGGAGEDVMHGGAGNDTYIVDRHGDVIVEDADGGADLVYSTVSYVLADNVDTLMLLDRAVSGRGSETDNQIYGNEVDNTLRGMGGADQLYGAGGIDLLDGGEGSDTLDGGSGADRMIGGKGDDFYVVDSLDDAVVERADEGTDTVRIQTAAAYVLGANIENGWIERNEGGTATGNRLANALTGAVGNDILAGAAGDDVLSGAAGDDVLNGGIGADQLRGGDGLDTASYAGSLAGVTVDLQSGLARGGDARGDTFASIENLTGSDMADSLYGDSGANTLSGGGGIDRLWGRAGDDVLRGGGGADEMHGGGGYDTLDYRGSTAGVTVDLLAGSATGGDAAGDTFDGFEAVAGSGVSDELRGDNAANHLSGGAGDDLILGRGGNDVIVGGAGPDRLHGGAGIDTLSYEDDLTGVTVNLGTGGAFRGTAAGDRFTGFENLRGGTGADELTGDASTNRIEGGAGNDALTGGGGDDVIEGGAGGDEMDGGDGIDTLSYANAKGIVQVHLTYGWTYGEDVVGDTFVNFENIQGSRNNDWLYGNSGANRIDGGAGDDYLDGFSGDDTLIGGEGKNLFVFMTGPGNDTVLDFSVADDRTYWVLGDAYDTASELLAVAKTVNGNTVFTLDADNSVTLVGVTADQLNFSHFVFPDPSTDM